jgi:hypothetical protein
MQALPPGPEPAELMQAKVAFFEALVDRNQRGAREAYAVLARYERPEPPPTRAELDKRQQRVRALAKWVEALRERRDEERRGIFRAMRPRRRKRGKRRPLPSDSGVGLGATTARGRLNEAPADGLPKRSTHWRR